MAGRPVDVALPVGNAQHLVELQLMPALERHPLRTHEPERAELHVIGTMPFASSVLSQAQGDPEGHARRMQSFAAELMRCEPFVGRDRPFLLIHSSMNTNLMGRAALRALIRGDLVVASADPMFALDARYGGLVPPDFARSVQRGVTIPYLAHHYAREASPGAGPPTSSRSGIMFHGGVSRRDFGLRPAVLELLRKMDSRKTDSRRTGNGADSASRIRVDLRVGEMSRGNQSALHLAFDLPTYAASGHAYKAASMCIVPAGDTPSSRRLFDSLAAGCVPVLARSYYSMLAFNRSFETSLPFPRSISWREMSIWLTPEVRGAWKIGCDRQGRDWLARWHESRCALEAMRRNGRSAFRNHLDYAENPGESLVNPTRCRTPPCSRM